MSEGRAASETSPGHRKRLGQYFSGTGLARLLAAFAQAPHAESIIDPMAGSGDMIAGCQAIGGTGFAAGIEVDAEVATACMQRLPTMHCVRGNAFAPSTLASLPMAQWDLVITNPPYVRYQAMKAQAQGPQFPSALQIRTDLLAALDGMPALDAEDREIFRRLVARYSGLADMAVPAWILCAAMTKPGGRLALVVPESWLSRDYSAVVRYILLRWFDIEWVIEDEHASWFPDAQVKTHLVVARRVARRASALADMDTRMFTRVTIHGRAFRNGSPIGDRLDRIDEVAFVDEVREAIAHGRTGLDGVRAARTPASHLAMGIGNARKHDWLADLEPGTAKVASHSLPACVESWVSRCGGSAIGWTSLSTLGVSVGQGLRTGANRFFYGVEVARTDRASRLAFDSPAGSLIDVPQALARPVVRRQSEIGSGFVVREATCVGRVLDLRTVALPEDRRAGGALAKALYASMPPALSRYVREAMEAWFGTPAAPSRIEDLSAVRTNMRKADVRRGIAPRFWYMLPDFAPRHMPDVFVPRINHGPMRAWMNPDKVLVDANFVTLWVGPGSAVDASALCALLNSNFVRAMLEAQAAVMGGGALKVEASHLRDVPMPSLDQAGWRTLSTLGQALVAGSIESTMVDAFLISAILGREATTSDAEALDRLVQDGLERRSAHRRNWTKDVA